MSASPEPSNCLCPKPPNPTPASIPATNTQPSAPFHPMPFQPHCSTSPDTILRYCSFNGSCSITVFSPSSPFPCMVGSLEPSQGEPFIL